MSYGFRVFGPSGQVVLDDSSFPYTGVTSGNTNDFPALSISGLRGPIIIPTDSMLFLSIAIGETNYTGPAPGEGNVGEIYATPSRNYVLARPFYNTALPSFGLAVFDAFGQVTFHTGNPLIAFRDSGSRFFPVSEGNNVSHTFTISSDVTHVAMFSSLRFSPSSPQNIAPAIGLGVERNNATSLSVKNVQIGIAPQGQGPFPVNLSILTARIV